MTDLAELLEAAPYCVSLGVRVESIDETSARFMLPFKEENSNPGNVLHGGVAASMINIAGLAVARAALGEAAGPLHTAAISLNYLAAAIGETLITEAQLLRKGKELCFADIAIRTESGKAVARGLTTVRGRFGAAEAPAVATRGDDDLADPGLMGPNLPKRVRFIGRLGMHVENMSQGQARIVMPLIEPNTDESGNVHEGAILALLDTTGAMAAWAHTGPGPYKASTVGVQAQLRAASGAEDLIAFGKMSHRDREVFWCDVEVASQKDRRVIAAGNVLYRIVTEG